VAKFEVAVYNMEVRQKVAEGEHHKRFTDDWADMHYVEIMADNEEGAIAAFERKHPRYQGFIIDQIAAID